MELAKEKLYRIKPELRGYFNRKDWMGEKRKSEWWSMGLDESALEEVEVEESPKITKIYLGSSRAAKGSAYRLSFDVIFRGDLGKNWNIKQKNTVATKILKTISPLLVGKTWDELAGEDGGKE